MKNSLRKEFLELLERDVEFRYAVAGFLGLSEVLKRLDSLSNEQVRLREEQIKLGEEQVRLSRELVKLREDMVAGFKRHEEEMVKLRVDFNRMYRMFDFRLTRVEKTLEKLTVDIEDEARSIIRFRLKTDLGLDVDVGSLTLPDLELNIYGVSNEVCVVGEATVRGGVPVLNGLLEKIELLKNRHPNRLRRKIIPLIYVCLPLPELVEEAKKKDIWVLKAIQDFYKPKRLEKT